MGLFSFLNFNPRPPRGGRPAISVPPYTSTVFQSTPSARRATSSAGRPAVRLKRFQSTPSARRATSSTTPASCGTRDFNPRPPRGGRHGELSPCKPVRVISIHALREEGDDDQKQAANKRPQFQSTPSARRATLTVLPVSTREKRFQSTPSARRATNWRPKVSIWRWDFNPRPPRGGRLRGVLVHGADNVGFQSTPSARRATDITKVSYTSDIFQSTPSARRATRDQPLLGVAVKISIHALREEGDAVGLAAGLIDHDFNPRPPRGGRRSRRRPRTFLFIFQSTPSARRATQRGAIPPLLWYDFNPRPPRGGRPRPVRPPRWPAADFNPRPPRGGRPPRARRQWSCCRYFNPRPPRGGRP